jgi:hypothetical protein
MDLIQPRMEASQQWTTVFGNAVISPRPLARGAVFRSGQTLQSSRSTPLGGTKRSIGSATTWPCDYRASTGPPGRSTSSTLGCRDLARSCRPLAIRVPLAKRGARRGLPLPLVCLPVARRRLRNHRAHRGSTPGGYRLRTVRSPLQRIDPTGGPPPKLQRLLYSNPWRCLCAMLIGYAGVSTSEQETAAQVTASLCKLSGIELCKLFGVTHGFLHAPTRSS